MYYVVDREKRENHPGQYKAVLYSTGVDGKLEKINVWKPGFKTPKIPRESMLMVPQDIWRKFEELKDEIQKEEEELGIADW